MTQSPEITGGTGFNFEAAVGGVYLSALLAEDSAPGLNNRIAKRVALQQKAFGEPLDYVIIDANSVDGEVARLSLQVKRNLTISAAKSNGDFREIVENSWLTLKKVDFRENIDRYGSATGTISDASYRELTTVCELARASLTSENFLRDSLTMETPDKNILKSSKSFVRFLMNMRFRQSQTTTSIVSLNTSS